MLVTAPKRNGKATLDLRDYNGFGQLVQIYRDGQRINFTYRPDDMRHSKEVTYPFKPALNRKTTHFWDGQNIVLETNTSGEIKAIYLRGVQLIAQQIGEEKFYYLHNAHGDVVQRIAENGISAPQYKYDAFGNEKEPNDTDPNPFRYCGEYFDFETGEYYFRARRYNPNNGRFISEDPAKDGLNWYIYCGNDPIKNVDPSGLSAQEKIKDIESDFKSFFAFRGSSRKPTKTSGRAFYFRETTERSEYIALGVAVEHKMTGDVSTGYEGENSTSYGFYENKNGDTDYLGNGYKGKNGATYESYMFTGADGSGVGTGFTSAETSNGMSMYGNVEFDTNWNLKLSVGTNARNGNVTTSVGVSMEVNVLKVLAVVAVFAVACALVPVIVPALPAIGVLLGGLLGGLGGKLLPA